MENKLYICTSADECGINECYSSKPHKRSKGIIDAYCVSYGERVNIIPYENPCHDIEIAFDDLLEDLC